MQSKIFAVLIATAAVTAGIFVYRHLTAEPRASDALCDRLADHVQFGSRERAVMTAQQMRRIAELVPKLCKSDRWSKEAAKCMIAATTEAASAKCGTLLTQQQRESAMAATRAVLGAP